MNAAIEDTKNSLLVALQYLEDNYLSLSDNDELSPVLFNLITFDSSFTPLYKESQLITLIQLEQARAFVNGIFASGGTEVLEPLKWVYERQGSWSKPSQKSIVVLTDGSVSNTEQVIEIVKNHNARVFSIGLGYAASTYLVNGIARAGKGVAEYVFPGEAVQRKVFRQLERAIASQMIDISSIDFGAESSIITPFHAKSSLLPHSRFLIYAYLNQFPQSDIILQLVNGEKITIEKSRFIHHKENTIHVIAARSYIRDLEEGQLNDKYDNDLFSVQNEIISVAEYYNLMSKETSFIAVQVIENSDGNIPMRTVNVPLPKPTGDRGGLESKMKIMDSFSVQSSGMKKKEISSGFSWLKSSAGSIDTNISLLLFLTVVILKLSLIG